MVLLRTEDLTKFYIQKKNLRNGDSIKNVSPKKNLDKDCSRKAIT